MQRILLLGAGRSVLSLVEYLKQEVLVNDWWLVIGDYSLELAEQKLNGFSKGNAIQLDVYDAEQVNKEVENSSVVISMLPAHLHFLVARACLSFEKSLFTASYVSNEIAQMHEEAKTKNLLFLMEMGLDPGIDHMSAKKEIDLIQEKGGEIYSFTSFTGGLVAPESDDNPWNYKFTWNPRNVVLAGKGTVKFLQNSHYKYIPYHQLFENTEKIEVEGYGSFEGYANRDSLKYKELYSLDTIQTLLRGTLRKEGFCDAWNVFVQLGMTDDSYLVKETQQMTYRMFLNSFLVDNKGEQTSVEEKIKKQFNITEQSELFHKLEWLGLFSDQPLELASPQSPANILQSILERKWRMKKEDKDMIVMQHQFKYYLENEKRKLTSSLVLKGDNSEMTSMAKTVGLPLGIAVKLYLKEKLEFSGVQIPIHKGIYEPVLAELESLGIKMSVISEKID